MAARLTSGSHNFILTWEPKTHLKDESERLLRAVDVYIQVEGHTPAILETYNDPTNLKADGNPAACAQVLSFLCTVAKEYLVENSEKKIAVKLLFSSQDGYIVRSDFLQVRMIGSVATRKWTEFVQPEQFLKAVDSSNRLNLHQVLEHAAGALVTAPFDEKDVGQVMLQVDQELRERISFPWVLPTPLVNKRLVIVGHRHRLIIDGWLETAYHLGIRLTIVGKDNVWLQRNFTHPALEQYLALDMTIDDGLPDRIVERLSRQSGKYDGITTVTDIFMVPTARAAVLLDLPTSPVEAIVTCLDKHATRMLDKGTNNMARVRGPNDLRAMLESGAYHPGYPLIVKPCSGCSSQGVFKVDSELELLSAVTKANNSFPDIDILIDTYVDGPEIDANFLLLDGETLFFEMVDNLPCPAELNPAGSINKGDFLEVEQIWPSGHPTAEQAIVQKRLKDILLNMGFRTGLFHMEARIQNSMVEYVEVNNRIDLRPSTKRSGDPPFPYLLEINLRPPGHAGSRAPAFTYGVDYNAVHFMRALGEHDRFAALSEQFRNGAQHWCDAVFINTEDMGVYDGENIAEELKKNRPDLWPYVLFSICYYSRGDVVEDSPARIGSFVVASKQGREHMLYLADEIKKSVKVKMKTEH